MRRIAEPVSAVHEMTEIHRRVLREDGPALLFETVTRADGARSDMPVLVNLFGRWSASPGAGRAARGWRARRMWPMLREPRPHAGLADASASCRGGAALAMRAREVARPPCRPRCIRGAAVDLGLAAGAGARPGEPAPLITWRWLVTRPPESESPSTTISASIACRCWGGTAPSGWLASAAARGTTGFGRALGAVPVAVVLAPTPHGPRRRAAAAGKVSELTFRPAARRAPGAGALAPPTAHVPAEARSSSKAMSPGRTRRRPLWRPHRYYNASRTSR